MTSTNPIIIAAQSESLCRSLQALLTTLPQMATVATALDAYALLAQVIEARPDLIVLEASLVSDKPSRIIEQIQAAAPDTRWLVLVDSIDEQRAWANAPVDQVLFKGYPAGELLAAIKQLLDQAR